MTIKNITSMAAAVAALGASSGSFGDPSGRHPLRKRKESGKNRDKTKAARKQRRKSK